MIPRILYLLIHCLLCQPVLGHGLSPQPPINESREISFPDTEQHLTLVFDPHTHTVFSDGTVWPSIRVDEAVRDGLDAIAMTDHMESLPHIGDIPHKDQNRSFQEAADAARYSDLLVISGAEITRKRPVGHMNAIFIKDVNKLYSVPESDEPYSFSEHRALAHQWPAQNAVDAANEQGGFVFLNHAWRPHPNGIPVLSDFHKENIRKGLLHGIEIANGKIYSEDAFQIALDHNLTLIGVSDVHRLIDWDYEPHKGGHRPVTLVFAEERSANSMKEALFDQRTAVWYKNWLMGREQHLLPLLAASLSFSDAAYQDAEILSVTITNRCDADFHLRSLSPYGLHRHAATFTVPQHSSERLMVRTGTVVDSLTMEFEVLNAFVAPNETARLKLAAEVE